MIARRLIASVSMSIVMLAGGAAVAGNANVDGVQLMDFDGDTHTLIAHPPGRAMGWYTHTNFTVHLPAPIARNPHGVPPNPCHGFAIAWNNMIAHSAPGAQRAQLVMLAVMASAQCNAELVTDPGTNPPTILSIQPTGT